jgi:hypothetical protein
MYGLCCHCEVCVKFRPEIEALLNHGPTHNLIARRYNTTDADFSRWMKRHAL